MFCSYTGNCLPNTAADTADFLLFVDKLFDSVNGSTFFQHHGKELRCDISNNSPHIPAAYLRGGFGG